MPSIVEVEQLEKANSRMWSAEGIANTFIGPPLGSLLLVVAFSLPFFVDAASFFAAAALVAAIPGSFRAERLDDHVQALADRRFALRSAFLLDGVIYTCLFVAGRSKLTTAKLEATRSGVTA